MKEKEILDEINRRWALGIDRSDNFPKLIFQKNDFLVKGYLLNYWNIKKVKAENFSESSLNQSNYNNADYSDLYIYLMKCLLDFENTLSGVIAVGRNNLGQPVLFYSNGINKQSLSTEFNDYLKDSFNTDKSDEIKSFYELEKSKISFMKFFSNYFYTYLAVNGKMPYLQRHDLYPIYSHFLDEKIIEAWIGFTQYRRIDPDISGFSGSNVPFFIADVRVEENSHLIFFDSFFPREKTFTLDYLLYDNCIVFLNDFNLANYFINNIDDYKHSEVGKSIKKHLQKKDVLFISKLGSVFEVSGISEIFKNNKYWIIKETLCEKESEKTNEIFLKGLVFETKGIETGTIIESLGIDGKVELKICGINKTKKILYSRIEPLELDYNLDENRLLWTERDRIYAKESGKFCLFVTEDDAVVSCDVFHNLFSDFFQNFLRFEDTELKNNVNKIKAMLECSALRLNDENYARLVNEINTDLPLLELVDAVCDLEKYWSKVDWGDLTLIEKNISHKECFDNLETEYGGITLSIIKSLSIRGKIEDSYFSGFRDFKHLFRNCYLKYALNGTNDDKAFMKKLLSINFDEISLEDCYEKRDYIYEFRNYLGMSDYTKELDKKIASCIDDLNYNPRLDEKKWDLDRTRRNVISITECILQYPKVKKAGLLDKFRDFSSFSSIYKTTNQIMNQIGLYIPEDLRNKLLSRLDKLQVLDRLPDFSKLKTIVTAVFRDLRVDKKYDKLRLKAVWKNNYIEKKYYDKPDCSFEAVIEKLISLGLLKETDGIYACVYVPGYNDKQI